MPLRHCNNSKIMEKKPVEVLDDDVDVDFVRVSKSATKAVTVSGTLEFILLSACIYYFLGVFLMGLFSFCLIYRLKRLPYINNNSCNRCKRHYY